MRSATARPPITGRAKPLADELEPSCRIRQLRPSSTSMALSIWCWPTLASRARRAMERSAFTGPIRSFPAAIRFGASAALAMAAKCVAVAALWKQRSGEGQDISIDVRKVLRRFCGFFEGKWETINGRGPSAGQFAGSPFFSLPLFRETRDGRHVIPLDFYPRLRARTLGLPPLQRKQRIDQPCDSAMARGRARGRRRRGRRRARDGAHERRAEARAAVRRGACQHATDHDREDRRSDPLPFKANAKSPLDGIRALGMGHVIAGAAIGRDLALYGADVLNIWRPGDSEVEAFAWDAQVGMRSTILDDSTDDRASFNRLLRDADIFFANKRPGFLKRHELDAEVLCELKPGLIHASVILHGEKGPWSDRLGFDEIGAAVSGLFAIEGSLERPQQPPIVSDLRQPRRLAQYSGYSRGTETAGD